MDKQDQLENRVAALEKEFDGLSLSAEIYHLSEDFSLVEKDAGRYRASFSDSGIPVNKGSVNWAGISEDKEKGSKVLHLETVRDVSLAQLNSFLVNPPDATGLAYEVTLFCGDERFKELMSKYYWPDNKEENEPQEVYVTTLSFFMQKGKKLLFIEADCTSKRPLLLREYRHKIRKRGNYGLASFMDNADSAREFFNNLENLIGSGYIRLPLSMDYGSSKNHYEIRVALRRPSKFLELVEQGNVNPSCDKLHISYNLGKFNTDIKWKKGIGHIEISGPCGNLASGNLGLSVCAAAELYKKKEK